MEEVTAVVAVGVAAADVVVVEGAIVVMVDVVNLITTKAKKMVAKPTKMESHKNHVNFTYLPSPQTMKMKSLAVA